MHATRLAAAAGRGTLFHILLRTCIVPVSRICATACLLFVIACAGHPATSSRVQGAEGSRGSDVITAAELAGATVSSGDALEAVQRLRPRFLNSRGSGSIRAADAGSVHVSLDGGPLQALSFLSRMRPGEIAEIRYLSASQAAQQFGTSAGTGGVMLVKSK